MTRVPVSELTGRALDWATDWAVSGKAFEVRPTPGGVAPYAYFLGTRWYPGGPPCYSSRWDDGGRLLDLHQIQVITCPDGLHAWPFGNADARGVGPNLLTAACRAIVCAKFGPEIDVPDELLRAKV